MRQIRRAAPVIVLTLLTACATAGPLLETEGRIALRAVEVQRAVQAVLEAADAANQAGVLSDTDLVTIARLGRRLGIEGGRLAAVLAQIDQARDPLSQAVGLGRAQILVQSLQSLAAGMPEVPALVEASLVALNATLTVLATELEI